MKSDMRNDFIEAINDSGVADFKLVNFYQYEEVLVKILDRFTDLGKKGLNSHWWWSNFKQPYEACMSNYAPDDILAMFDHKTKIWFVAEDWHNNKRNGCFWLYESSLKSAVEVLKNMYGFEYYIVSRKLDWLIGENHHSVLYGVDGEAYRKVKQLKEAKA